MVAISFPDMIQLLLLLIAGIMRTGSGGGQASSLPGCDCACDSAEFRISPVAPHAGIKGALLGTRFQSLDELKQVISIRYVNTNTEHDTIIRPNARVYVRHCSHGTGVVGVLEAGISQGDISDAKDGNFQKRLRVLLRSPFAVENRKDLERVYLLARLRPWIFGEGDVAFFNIAETSVRNINTPDLAFLTPGDSTEKGYLNTFNHITAQAFITTCFSEELADFVADAHERYLHPQLILGKFTESQLNDLAEGPVDNYVDVVNNEWGQEIGKELRKKYHISRKTRWTPELLANYLNDVQHYYGWAFQIGFEPFSADDEQVIKFARKINLVIGS
jgi:hypothetical protein